MTREMIKMPDLLIRDVPGQIVEALKKKAAENRRSLQQELMMIIESAAKEDRIEKAEYATMIRERLQAYGKEYTDSAELFRADRNR
jgi:antitoxin FitA